MRFLSTRIMSNEVANGRTIANELLSIITIANEAVKHKNNDKCGC